MSRTPTAGIQPERAVQADASLSLRKPSRTLVDQAADSIVAAAARGAFLPGDRLVEAEIARDLGISRVPVREALRLLESQGIVVSTPYKGVRLMAVTNDAAGGFARMRIALEALAVRECVERGPAAGIVGMRAANGALRIAARRRDRSSLIMADHDFHAALFQSSGNPALINVWRGLSGQMAVLWGLVYGNVVPTAILIEEHQAVLEAIERRDADRAAAAVASHLERLPGIDYESALQARLAERSPEARRPEQVLRPQRATRRR
ncbi:GntR family transcriptional regulator [Plastoroseomonas hellenica]|uniref:GntR family transcriptional regulator n=1 Tax=Plastoroseomonas hellenica TaxID=2687306 RepID=A0ABS5F1A1_9PROT|nr:GntR family transcriptional regulator [Plastoroseomonas hellenica]MBR0643721.1 GntR family transcriptional regulator [Plastoroseomonas hellenica]MBR0666322.1 GntR family transcriptional regulator [Plastoroseomonas hellenica]